MKCEDLHGVQVGQVPGVRLTSDPSCSTIFRSGTLHLDNSPLFKIMESCKESQLSIILNSGELSRCNVPDLQIVEHYPK